jgi:hypothetical protein
MNEPQAAAGRRWTFVRQSPLKIAGVLYVVAVFQFFVFELVAATLYPGYSVARNYISDLGATCANPPSTLHCVVHQPTANIFDATVFLLGLMLLAGTCFVIYGTRKKLYCLSAASIFPLSLQPRSPDPRPPTSQIRFLVGGTGHYLNSGTEPSGGVLQLLRADPPN